MSYILKKKNPSELVSSKKTARTRFTTYTYTFNNTHAIAHTRIKKKDQQSGPPFFFMYCAHLTPPFSKKDAHTRTHTHNSRHVSNSKNPYIMGLRSKNDMYQSLSTFFFSQHVNTDELRLGHISIGMESLSPLHTNKKKIPPLLIK